MFDFVVLLFFSYFCTQKLRFRILTRLLGYEKKVISLGIDITDGGTICC